MTIHSARRHIDRLGTARGYCFGLTLDACMHSAELPDKYVDTFGDAYRNQSSEMFNTAIKRVIEEFFGYTAAPNNAMSHVAQYTAYGASAQSYCPNVPYKYDASRSGFTNKQLRLAPLLTQASKSGCNILFSSPSKTGEHVVGLDLVDDQPISYLVRNTGGKQSRLAPVNNRVYTSHDLWQPQGEASADGYTPLPEFKRPHYPDGKSSWELFIFPPEPK